MNRQDWKYGKVVVNSKFTSALSWVIDIYGITLYPFIVCKEEPGETTINHERIHIFQQKELLVVFFYLLYVMFWIINLIKYRKEENPGQVAYMNIPFEREAYQNQGDFTYLLKRKRYAWRKYI